MIDKTEESDSSIQIYTSLDNGENWTEITEDNAYISDITTGQDLTNKTLSIKGLFHASDGVSPVLHSLSIEFTRLIVFDNNSDRDIFPEITIKNLGTRDIKLINITDNEQEFGFRDIEYDETLSINTKTRKN